MIEIKEWNQQFYLGNEFDSSRTTLFFLHGFPDNFRVWDKVYESLRDKFNIICPSAPGTVIEKLDLAKEYRLENLSRYYREILLFEMKEMTPITIIAHDMAGPYAHHMLDFLPCQTKLICINTLSGQMFMDRKFNPNQVFRSSYMSVFQMPFVNKNFVGKFWYEFRKSAALLGQSAVMNIPDSYTENILNGFNFYKSLLKDVPKFMDGRSWANEVHYIWSTNDPFLVRPTDKEMRKRYLNWKIEFIKSGHWPMLDDPELLASLIESIHTGVSNE